MQNGIMACKKAKQEKSPAEYLSFVAIDTDVNELRKIKAVSNDVVTIQTSSRMTIGEYLEYDSNARENWFPINDIILDKTPSEAQARCAQFQILLLIMQ